MRRYNIKRNRRIRQVRTVVWEDGAVRLLLPDRRVPCPALRASEEADEGVGRRRGRLPHKAAQPQPNRVLNSCTILACLCLLLAGCADVGEPVYPSAKIPVAPNDLVAIERGDHLAVQFTASSYTTEAQLITEMRGAEVRVGPARQPFNAAAWAKSAEACSLMKPAEKPGPVQASCPASAFVGSNVVVGARVLNIKGRPSAWSNFVPLRVQPPVPAPVDVSAAAVPEGVRLTWSDPDVRSFVVFRQSPADKQPAQLGKTDQPAYLDRTTVYGTEYQYWVQGLRENAESDAAASNKLTPVDVFPPAVPAGVTAAAGIDSIELAWERNTEPDFRKYVIYRAVDEGPFEKLAETDVPTYSDKAIQSSKIYRYAVSAVDQAGNASSRSAIVEAAAP